MTKGTLIRRTRILAALWLLALAAIASADQAKACPLSGQQECPSQEGDAECSLELFRLAALPVRLHQGDPGVGHLELTLDDVEPPVTIAVDPTTPSHGSKISRDVLRVAPKNSPPLFA